MVTTELNISELLQEAFALMLIFLVIFCLLYQGARYLIKGLREYFKHSDNHSKFTMR